MVSKIRTLINLDIYMHICHIIVMNLTRTSLRLDTELKKEAEKLAIEENITLQDMFNEALSLYIEQKTSKKAQKITFITHDIGNSLDNLTRDDMYE